jgi:hypothetical protein
LFEVLVFPCVVDCPYLYADWDGLSAVAHGRVYRAACFSPPNYRFDPADRHTAGFSGVSKFSGWNFTRRSRLSPTGPFALACVAGAMYLVQERQLKTHQLRSIFYHLPAVA